ncbi:hypothetical protein [Caldinitratiruptor microaerophilus]|uniref:Uncharacterized protein n=1 Tax=Caldinitratiruptor microaerophilus TaxID=671077 RepID=A0AA35CMA0_9FIRM|nr:hypothetical protein [Caldinitratiruptor microaerophilus]BDG59905.1 hypothetical protein caldi_09950 [Caldinitratiruptor microaerophilus]
MPNQTLTTHDYQGWRSRTAGPELEGFGDIKPGYTLLCQAVEYRPPQDANLVLAVVDGEERFGWLVRNGDTWYLENQHGDRRALPGLEAVREVVVRVMFDPYEGEDAGTAAAK